LEFLIKNGVIIVMIGKNSFFIQKINILIKNP
jgi:hypothetical protein